MSEARGGIFNSAVKAQYVGFNLFTFTVLYVGMSILNYMIKVPTVVGSLGKFTKSCPGPRRFSKNKMTQQAPALRDGL